MTIMINQDNYMEYNCILYEINGFMFFVNKVELENTTNTSLVVFGGFSHESTNKTFQIMTNSDNISKLNKYKNIITIYYPIEFKEKQIEIFNEFTKYHNYSEEIKMNKEFALLMNELLRQLNLTDVHLLGKCAGCGLAIHTFVKNPDIFGKLILCVPASPNDIQDLKSVSTLNTKQFLFVWNSNDKMEFKWGLCNSDEEINKYKKTISEIPEKMIINVNTQILLTDKDYHDVPTTIFEYL